MVGIVRLVRQVKRVVGAGEFTCGLTESIDRKPLATIVFEVGVAERIEAFAYLASGGFIGEVSEAEIYGHGAITVTIPLPPLAPTDATAPHAHRSAWRAVAASQAHALRPTLGWRVDPANRAEDPHGVNEDVAELPASGALGVSVLRVEYHCALLRRRWCELQDLIRNGRHWIE